MTKVQQATFIRRANTIQRRGLRRGFQLAINTQRELEALAREYRLKDFTSLARTKTAKPS